MGSLSLLQGIFQTQGPNPGLHCRGILYQLSHKGSSGVKVLLTEGKCERQACALSTTVLTYRCDRPERQKFTEATQRVTANTKPKSGSPSRAPFAKPERLQKCLGPSQAQTHQVKAVIPPHTTQLVNQRTFTMDLF